MVLCIFSLKDMFNVLGSIQRSKGISKNKSWFFIQIHIWSSWCQARFRLNNCGRNDFGYPFGESILYVCWFQILVKICSWLPLWLFLPENVINVHTIHLKWYLAKSFSLVSWQICRYSLGFWLWLFHLSYLKENIIIAVILTPIDISTRFNKFHPSQPDIIIF